MKLDRAETNSHAGDKLFLVERLGEVIVGSGLKSFYDALLVTLAGQHNDMGIRLEGNRSQTAADLQAIQVGHHPVHDDESRPMLHVQVDCLPTRSGEDQRVGLAKERLLDQLSCERRIFDD